MPLRVFFIKDFRIYSGISRIRVLTKLYNIGNRGNFIHWIKYFLQGRVVVNNEFSDWASAVSDIPQLFIIFINDILKCQHIFG